MSAPATSAQERQQAKRGALTGAAFTDESSTPRRCCCARPAARTRSPACSSTLRHPGLRSWLPRSTAARLSTLDLTAGDRSVLAEADPDLRLRFGRLDPGTRRIQSRYEIAAWRIPADRAAALSGVPISTVHYWARKNILIPSVSPERRKLWSYPDLMGLRIIYWLRHAKTGRDGQEVPASTMPMVKAVLAQLEGLDLALWSEEHGPRVRVDLAGKILVTAAPHPEDASGQVVLAQSGELDVLEPFQPSRAKAPPGPSPPDAADRAGQAGRIAASDPYPA